MFPLQPQLGLFRYHFHKRSKSTDELLRRDDLWPIILDSKLHRPRLPLILGKVGSHLRELIFRCGLRLVYSKGWASKV